MGETVETKYSEELELDDEEQEEEEQASPLRRVSVAESLLTGIFNEKSLSNLRRSMTSTSVSHLMTPPPAAESIKKDHSYPCANTFDLIPPPPEKNNWPQLPLTLKPTPKGGMTVRGVRYSSSKEYIHLPGYCSGCTLPVNSGREVEGKSLVIDFETDLFVGTALFRIKDCHPAYGDDNNDAMGPVEDSYFYKRQRSFQAVIKGRFLTDSLPMSECVTGQYFSRPPGRLPSDWILKGAIKIISTLAPQLDAKLDKTGESRFLSPMMSAAQTILVEEWEESQGVEEAERLGDVDTKLRHYYPGANESIESHAMTEPDKADPQSVVNALPFKPKVSHWTSVSHQKVRKKAFDTLHKKNLKTPTFDPNKEYTFEFYSHLLSLNDMTLDLGKTLGGKYSLKEMLNGQPVKFMAARKVGEDDLQWLWSFDIWNEVLYEDAHAFYNEE